MTDPAFAALIDRVRARDPQAAVDFVRSVRPGLERFAAGVLRRADLAHRIDPEDVCQDVMATFFGWLARADRGLDDPDRVGRLLRKAVRNRIVDETRRALAARRGGTGSATATNADDCLDSAPANCGTPSAAVSHAEIAAAIDSRLTADERDLIERRRAGQEWAAIAAAVGGTPDGVRKKLGRAVDRVLGQLGLTI